MNTTMEAVIQRIEELRNGMQLSSSAFALSIGENAATYMRSVNGTNKMTLKIVLEVLAKYPEVSADWLIKGIDTPIDGELSTAPAPTEAAQNDSDADVLLRTIVTLQRVIDEQQQTIRELRNN